MEAMEPTAAGCPSDAELVASYQQTGRPQHLDALLERHVGRLWRMIHGMVLNHADADDLTQEVLLRAIRGLSGFNGRSEFSTWLYRVAVNTTHRFLRQRGRRPVASEAAAADRAAARSEEPDRKAVQAEMQLVIAAGLEALSPPLRTAMVLMSIGGLPAREAAAIEGCSPATMYWRVHEARRILKGQLAEYLT